MRSLNALPRSWSEEGDAGKEVGGVPNMEIVVHKYARFEDADAADDARYRAMSGDETLQLLLELNKAEPPTSRLAAPPAAA
jgi:hypothetical protein